MATRWLPGMRITAARLNTDHSMVVTGAPTLATSGSYLVLPFNQRVSGSGDVTWSSVTNPQRITVQAAGTYSLAGRIVWPASLSANDARAEIRVNGSVGRTRVNTQRGSPGNATAVLAGYEVLDVGDYVELWANQNSGLPAPLLTLLGLHLVSSALA